LYPVNGAASRVKNNATPWSYRDAVWGSVIGGVDPDPANKEKISAWATGDDDADPEHKQTVPKLVFILAIRLATMLGSNPQRDRVHDEAHATRATPTRAARGLRRPTRRAASSS
jgi:hypothetical protein